MKEIEKTPLHILGNFDVLEKGEEKETERIIAGYASIVQVDNEDDYIPKATLEKGIETLLKNSDYSNLMLNHKSIQIGKVLKEYKQIRTHVDDHGLFIVAQIRDDLEAANSVWEAILLGLYNAFSIAAEVLKAREECNEEKCIRVVEKMNIFEVTVCNKPKNNNSGFVVISKAECEAEENVEDVNINRKDIMTKKSCEPCNDSEEVKEEVTKSEPEENIEEPKEAETETEVVEESVEKGEFDMQSAVESLSRQIEALTGIISDMAKQEEETTELAKEEEEEEEDEEDKEEMKKSEEPEEPKEPEAPEMPDVDPLDDIRKAISTIMERLDIQEKIDEMNLSLKARDDKIAELEKQLNVISKSDDENEEEDIPDDVQPVEAKKLEAPEKPEEPKETPKALSNVQEEKVWRDSPIVVRDGYVTGRK